MATVPDPIDFGTCRLNKKIITKLRTHFELLQYIPHISKIEISILLNDILVLFQLFFSDK